MRYLFRATNCLIWLSMLSRCAVASDERTLSLDELTGEPVTIQAHKLDDSGKFTFWFPAGADELVLPISAGVDIDTSRSDSMQWLRAGSPWSLIELPIVGVRYRDQMVIVIAPWPHYAEIVVNDRFGIQFSLPQRRHDAAPVEIVAMRRETEDPMEVAWQFRKWREKSKNIGVIPRPRSLRSKIVDLPNAERLLGAPHIYLWGPTLFSRHDIAHGHLKEFAGALKNAKKNSLGAKITSLFTDEQRSALADPTSTTSSYDIPFAINEALASRKLLNLDAKLSDCEVIKQNEQAFVDAYGQYLNPVASWGDGLSVPLIRELHDAGVDRALLLLADLHQHRLRPDVAAYAAELGYLLGPYDSYHSIHPPNAEVTWETAQFDSAGFESGRVINADGSGHAGFMNRGFHFAPKVAKPYVKQRVDGILKQAAYSTWFVDCDATGECFEDYSPEHPATKLDDTKLRRERLDWLEKSRHLVIGSEGGSILFSDVVHYGHGVHTPYIVHLEPAFRDPKSPYFLGRALPPAAPEREFKATSVPPSVKSPYFDPTARIPLYQACISGEMLDTHHWSMDSLKFQDVAQIRELMEILYMVPPMYHLNRDSWPQRRERIVKHVAFWSPLHRELATAPMTRFECLSKDRLVQRTTFQTANGETSITVNFGENPQVGLAPFSATVSGPTTAHDRTYTATK